MKQLKKILSLMLVLIMCFSVVPMTDLGIEVSAADYPTDLNSMRARADAIVEYEWIPAQNINTWNGNTYNGRTYFKKGEIVTGMPYTLFTSEVVGDSLLSLYQYKGKAKSNYSTTAYCNSTSSNRTGPVYGSCCATFVSEVFGGSLMSGNNPVEDSCKKLISSKHTDVVRNATVSDIKEGDALVNTDEHHIIWIYKITSSEIIVYEQTPPIARKKTISKPSGSKTLSYNGSNYPTIVRSKELKASEKPTITSVKGESHSEITIKWGKVDSATKYKVERRKSGTDDYVVAVSSTTSTSFTDTGLEKGQRYFYKVTAYNGSTKLGASESVGVYTKFSPPTVTAVSNSKLQVSWSSISKAVDYTVMRRKASEDEYSEIKTVTGTSFTDSGLSSSTKYYYWIKANCEVDGVDMVAKSTTGGQYTLTNSPEITNINDISKSEISLTWKAVSGASSYRIERRKSGTDTYTTIINSTTNTSYTDSGLATGERYYYKVYAKNEGGESAASTSVGGYTKFNQPTVQTVNTTQLKLTWNAVSKAESYTIKRRAYNETSYKDIKTVTSTSYTDTGLNSGTKYYYWIQANCNIDGTSMVAKSTTGSNLTQITTPSVSVVSSSSLKLSWSAIKDNGTYKYNIQRKAPGESSYKTIATVNTCSYTDTGLKSSSTYYYKIQVVSSNNSICLTSSEVSGKTASCTHSTTEIRNAKSATCTAIGYTGDTYCKTCGTKTKTGTTIAKKSHNSNTTIPAVAATCTKTGLTEGKKCSVCGTVTVAQQTVAKKAHNSNTTIPAVAATCKATGLTEGKKCSVCGTVTVAQQIIAKKSHVDNNGDYKCDYGCGYAFEKPAPDTPTTPDEPENKPCSCNCHKGGISGFFFKLINFFEKLFGKNKVCACGVKH
ncbi:MAG: fibronectin type III domain-containing protein [Clostridia bacterium]|nr:fibronectin type III domain-containing protein [Clostridia bacterium]